MPRGCRLHTLTYALAVVLVGGVCGRAAAASQLHVDWQGPPCASVAAFHAGVRSALQRDPEQLLTSPLHVRVLITESVGKQGFTLVLATQYRQAELSRELTVDRCSEAVEAAALVVALAIDPAAAREQGAQDQEGGAPVPARPHEPSLTVHTAALFGVSAREVPAPSPAVQLAVGVRAAKLGVGVEVTWVRAQYEAQGAEQRGGNVGLSGAGLSLCYVPVARALSLWSCALGHGGAWRAWGVGISDPERQRRAWLAMSARVGAGLSLHERLSVVAAGDLQVLLTRPRFVIDGVGTVYRPGPVGARFWGGLELRL
jgi:hypothetical protein